MCRFVLLPVSLVCLAGCTHTQLQHRTVSQASTVSDLQYQQVLSNLAQFACNPEALPWHVKLTGGVIQVSHLGSAAFGAELPTEGPSLYLPTVAAERSNLGQWDVEPAVEADTLEHLRLAYQFAFRPDDPELRQEIYEEIGRLAVEFRVLPSEKTVLMLWQLFGQEEGEAPDEAARKAAEAEIRAMYRAARKESLIAPKERGEAQRLLAMLHEWVAEDHIRLGPEEVVATHNLAEIEQVVDKIEKLQDLLEKPIFQAPWIHVACDKKDVPKAACYVGRHCAGHKQCCYVWVAPEHYRTLREFTLTILALAPPERQEVSPFGPVFSPALLR